MLSKYAALPHMPRSAPDEGANEGENEPEGDRKVHVELAASQRRPRATHKYGKRHEHGGEREQRRNCRKKAVKCGLFVRVEAEVKGEGEAQAQEQLVGHAVGVRGFRKDASPHAPSLARNGR